MPTSARWFHPIRTGLALALASGLVCVAGPLAQEPPAQEPPAPVFRSGIDAVSVDVIVTDRQGRPVTDLTAADFEIREAGELQAVTTFKLIETGTGGAASSAAARQILSLEQERSEAARLENRLFVVFLDDYHVRRGNSMRSRQQLADFLRTLSANDLVAVATPLSGVSRLSFSRNHNLTADVVMDFEGRKYDYTPRHPIEERYQTLPVEEQERMRNSLTITALQSLSEYLGTLREGRKSIIYVSEGMSASVPSGLRVTGTPTEGMPLRRPRTTARAESLDIFEGAGLLVDLESRVFRSAARNNVSIYTLDPRGLANFEFGINEDVTAEADRRILQESADLLRVMAEQTDGRAIVGRNDPLPGLRQMVQDHQAYYLLGYNSTRSPRDGRFHEIRVRVTRRDVEVRARKGYWAFTAEDVARAAAAARPESPREVTAALDAMRTSAAERRAVSVWMGALRADDERAAVTFAWEARPGAAATPGEAVDRVSIVATTLGGEEVFRGPVTRSSGLARGGGSVTFEAPAGPLRVRITPENARGLRLDVDEAALEVPDFTSAGPRLTTPFLYRGRTARDLQQLRVAEAPLPVVTAVFGRAERMLIRFGAYGAGGVAPALTLRLLNQTGQPLAALPTPVARSGAEGVFESELGLGAFPPGDYLVEIAAEQSGQLVKQLVALRVTG